jgi:hypothetical protein
MYEFKQLIQIILLSAGLSTAGIGFCDVVKVSNQCSEELYKNDVHIVLVIRNNSSVDYVMASKNPLLDVTFPLYVKYIGDEYDEYTTPKAITLVPYSRSPVQTLVCWWGLDGKYHCK